MDTVEITRQELAALAAEQYILVDTRSVESASFGMMPGAVSIPETELMARKEELPREKKIVLYCAKGLRSVESAEQLRQFGLEAYSLAEGFNGWTLETIQREQDVELEEQRKRIEQSIRKQFHRSLFSRFTRAIREYELIQANDRIAVCISGGKDSMLMAKLFQELQKHSRVPFELVYLVMDPGYSETNRRVIEHNAELMGISLTIFETRIFDAVYKIENNPCYLCARMRRGHLYNKAKELGCNKIALGHHYNDVIETILMGMLYGSQIQTMMPKLHSDNFEGMELIRPMYLIHEEDIKKWRDANDLHFIQCACRFTENCMTCNPDGRTSSKRMEIKHLISEMKKTNPAVEGHIFRSVENVNLKTIIAYKQNGVRHHFLETYDTKGERT